MATMCAVAQRTWIHARIEEFTNDPDPRARAENRERLREAMCVPYRSTIDALFEVGVLSRSNAKHQQMQKHVDTHWYGSKNNSPYAWWPDHPEAEAIILEAWMQLLGDSQYADLPIRIIWLCSGEYFQCVIDKSATQVTLIELTPPIPGGHALVPATHLEDLIVVASQEDAEYCRRAASRQGGSNPVRPPRPGQDPYVAILECFSEDPTGT